MIQQSEIDVLEQMTERLSSRFPAVSPDVVTSVVRDQHARFDGSRIRDFIPLFVERHATTRLESLGV